MKKYLVKWKESWYCDVYSGSDDRSETFTTLKEAKQKVEKLKKDRDVYDVKIYTEMS